MGGLAALSLQSQEGAAWENLELAKVGVDDGVLKILRVQEDLVEDKAELLWVPGG